MTTSQLVEKLVALVRQETNLTLEVIKCLGEVEAQEIHLEMGYSSLYEFAMTELGYSEGAAFRRINVLRLIRHEPSVEKDINDGKLTLSTAARIEAFCRKTGIERSLAVEKVKGMNSREAERTLLGLAPEALPDERTRPLSPTHTEVRLIADQELMAELNRMRELLSHVDPAISYAGVIKRSTKSWLSQNDPLRREGRGTRSKRNRAEHQATSAPKPEVRFATGTLRAEVTKRDEGQCTYTSPTSGRRCTSRYLIETDHVIPWSNGGATKFENLRLLCKAHNRFVYGRPPH